MSSALSCVNKWRWGALASLAMVVLSLIPQFHLWIVQGRDWNGAYVSPQSDEPLYSAYVNSLIDGRTRKNDPFGGRDDTSGAPLPESLFSIQFVPAYLIALPSRALGSSASTAFIFLIAVAALLTSGSLFWLLYVVSGDDRLASAGTLIVLCLGGLLGKFGLFGTFIDIPFPVLPFLRRYQPALTFPLFFVFTATVWQTFSIRRKKSSRVLAIIAGLTLAVLIFSYVYLWTAAAAWLFCFSILWLSFRSSERWETSKSLLIICGTTAFALVPYLFLAANQTTLDQQLVLVSSRRPDLLRAHEILGAGILGVLIAGVMRKRIQLSGQQVLFAVSLAILPFIVFNQQIVTGKTMQSFHFESYVVNYSTMVGCLVTIALFWQPVSRRLLLWLAGLSLAWGVVAVGLPARFDSVPAAIAVDKSVPVFLRLSELSRGDGTIADLRTKGRASTVVFSPNVRLTKWLSTWTSQPTLLNQTGIYCGTQSREEQKRSFYMHLYYSRVRPETLRQVLVGTLDPPEELVSAPSVIFGHGRIFPQLTDHFNAVQSSEIEEQVSAYKIYSDSFSREEVLRKPITYTVTRVDNNFDFTNLDKWYERDTGERLGDYVLYRLKLR